MAALGALMVITVTAALAQIAMGADFMVGGVTSGWDLTTNLQAWASAQSFTTGDSLTFSYSTLHSVLEVSKADYDACQTSNPIQIFTNGNTVIKLSSSGKRYFICGTSGHCSQGMKVEIDALSAAALPPPPLTPRLAPPPITASPPPLTKSPPPSKTHAPSADAPLSSPSPSSSPSLTPIIAPSVSPSVKPAASDPAAPQASAAHGCSLKVTVAEWLAVGVLIALAL